MVSFNPSVIMADSPHLYLASCNFFLQKEGFFKPFVVLILRVKNIGVRLHKFTKCKTKTKEENVKL